MTEARYHCPHCELEIITEHEDADWNMPAESGDLVAAMWKAHNPKVCATILQNKVERDSHNNSHGYTNLTKVNDESS